MMWISIVGAAAAAVISVIATARAYVKAQGAPPAFERSPQPARGQVDEWVWSADTPERVISTLAHTELFGKLDPKVLERVAAATFVQRFDRGDAIFLQDDPGDRMYVVAAGEVKLVLNAADGSEIELGRRSWSDFFGEFALLDGLPRTASAIAVQPTSLIVMTRDELFKLLPVEPEVGNALFRSLVSIARKTDSRIAGFGALDLELQGKVARDLLRMASRERGALVVPGVSTSDLADRVSATRQSVNGVLRVFQERGYIRLAGRSARILNPEGLRERAAARHG
jgi:CRP/FNR family cyclic AMP-dependent transcriptional regulator